MELNKVETQLMYEQAHSKYQKKALLKSQFKNIVELPEEIENRDYVESVIIDVMAILLERQSIYISSVIEMLCERDLERSEELIKIVLLGGMLGYYTLNQKKHTIQLISKYSANELLQERLDNFKYLNPMLVRPLPVNSRGNNRGSGYLTVGNDSLILGGVHHTKDIDSAFLDKLNQTKFSLNIDVIRAYRNKWKCFNEGKVKEDVMRAFEHYEKGCYKAFAQMISQGNEFYLTHKYDKRGRVYNCGYYISPQGNSYAKSVLELANKELISKEVNFFED